MERQNTMRWILFLSVFTYSINTFAQVRGEPGTSNSEKPILGTIINGGNFGSPVAPAPLIVDRSCIYDADFSVLVANLQPDVNGRYFFPQGEYSPMTLRVNVGNSQTCHPITEFFPYSVVGYDNVFYATVRVPVDVKNECADNIPNENGGSLSADIDWYVELMTGDGAACEELSEYYPVCTFTSPGSLFACDVFSFNNEECPVINCDDYTEAVHFGSFDIDCGTCTRRIIAEEPVAQSRTVRTALEAFSVAPNPFWDVFTISWDARKVVPHSIEISNLQGQLIRHWEAVSLEGRQYLRVDTGDFPSGVYFATILYGGETLTKKIVKQ